MENLKKGPRFRIVPLEERILLDATVAATALFVPAPDGTSVPDAGAQGSSPVMDHTVTQNSDTTVTSSSNDDSASQSAQDSPVNPSTSFSPENNTASGSSTGKNVLIMPTNVENYQTLIKAAKSNVKVIEYNPETTTLQQLYEKMSEQITEQVDSIAFANKGQQDYFVISSDYAVSSDTLQNSPALQHFWTQIGHMVKDGGQISIFACNFSQLGLESVNAIQNYVNLGGSSITVLSSTDLTSNIDLGGNWFMEVGGVDVGIQYFNHDELSQFDSHLLTFTVTNTNASGAGSFFQSLVNANNAAGFDTITFAITAGTNPVKVLANPDTATFQINGSVNIDASTQGVSITPLITFRGHLLVNASDVTIKGFNFTQNNGTPTILVNAGSNFNLINNFFGSTADGTALSSGFNTVEIHNRNGVNVLGNLFAGARGEALNIMDSTNVVIDGALVGTNASASATIGVNALNGIVLDTVTNATLKNLTIGGSAKAGILVKDNSTNITIENSYIGTNSVGVSTTAFRNLVGGVAIDHSSDVTIKTSTISNNVGNGILVSNASFDITIQNNHIGTNAVGVTALPNTLSGVAFDNSTGSLISSNTLSGNSQHGISLTNNSDQILIQSNKIGVQDDGVTARANANTGINIVSSDDAMITNNTISRNSNGGINLVSSNNTTISNNFIGVSSTGAVLAGNTSFGIQLQNVDTVTISGNTISGNTAAGLKTATANVSVTNLTLSNNFIGTDVTGLLDFGNNIGVTLNNVTNSTISNNTISGNTNDGIDLTNAQYITLTGNVIGLNSLSTAIIANTGDGIEVNNSSNLSFSSNVISGNSVRGLIFFNVTDLNINSNYIGTTATTLTAFGNVNNGLVLDNVDNAVVSNVSVIGSLTGIYVKNNSSNVSIESSHIGTNTAGTNATAFQNRDKGILIETSAGITIKTSTISNNISTGIYVNNSSGVTILENHIGTNDTGTTSLRNTGNGITFETSSNSSVLSNTISGNGSSGIFITLQSNNLTIENNKIGVGDNGTTARANSLHGVFVNASNSISMTGNTISGNTSRGINLIGADDITIQNNKIGMSSDGNTKVANIGNGIFLENSDNTVILNNIVSGNSGSGIVASTIGSINGLTIKGNTIGLDITGLKDMGNNRGIDLINVTNVSIDDNIISGNQLEGILINNAANVNIKDVLVGLNSDESAAISNNGEGIKISNSSNITFSNSTFAGNLGDGILFTNVSNIDMTFIRAGVKSLTNSAFGNGGDGIEFNNVTSAFLQFGTVSGNSGTGILIANSSDITLDIVTVGTNAFSTTSTSFQNKDNGIIIDSSFNILMMKSTSSNNVGSGIIVRNNSTNITLDDTSFGVSGSSNISIPNSESGIVFDQSTDSFIINSNISANNENGIRLLNQSNNILIENNRIGINEILNAAHGNLLSGIIIENSDFTKISNNTISYNLNGISLVSSNSTLIDSNVIAYNLDSGIYLENDNLTVISSNIISGNVQKGIYSEGSTVTNLIVSGNYIGTDVTGQLIDGNGSGIKLYNISNSSILNNIISGNNEGLYINNGSYIEILGNYVGTNMDGTIAVRNTDNGAFIINSNHLTIMDNVFSGNKKDGLRVEFSDQMMISNNYFGTDPTGSVAIANAFAGLRVVDSSNILLTGNVISGNIQEGAVIRRDIGIEISNNMIGVDKTGTYGIGNGFNGLEIDEANQLLIKENVVSGNKLTGINMVEPLSTIVGSDDFKILNNKIGTDITGSYAIPNLNHGIALFKVTNAVISFNVISGNGNEGFRSATTDGIQFSRNFIGLNHSAEKIIGNGANGIFIIRSKDALVEFNVVSGNKLNGLNTTFTDNILIINNYFGTNLMGDSTGNGGSGVQVEDTENVTVIGNVISKNTKNGVYFIGNTNSLVFSNQIFDNKAFGVSSLDSTGTLVKNNNMTGNVFGIEFSTSIPGSLPISPVITQSSTDLSGNVTIAGLVFGKPGDIVTVDLYANSTRGANGQFLFYEIPVQIGPNGQGVFAYSGFLPPAPFITATMTDANGNTSNFSIDVPITNFVNAVVALNSKVVQDTTMITTIQFNAFVYEANPIGVIANQSGTSAPQVSSVTDHIVANVESSNSYNYVYSPVTIIETYNREDNFKFTLNNINVIKSNDDVSQGINMVESTTVLPLLEFAKQEALEQNSTVVAVGITSTAVLSQLSQIEPFDTSESKRRPGRPSLSLNLHFDEDQMRNL